MPRRSAAAEDPDALIAFLHSESHHLDDHMRKNFSQVYQYGGVVFGLLTAAAPVLGKSAQYDALLAIPPLMLMVWFVGLRALAEGFALAAKREATERRLAEVLRDRYSEDFVSWEQSGGKVMMRSFTNAVVFVAFALLTVAIFVFCFYTAWTGSQRRHGVIKAEIAVVAAVAIGVAIAGAETVALITRRVHRLTGVIDSSPQGDDSRGAEDYELVWTPTIAALDAAERARRRATRVTWLEWGVSGAGAVFFGWSLSNGHLSALLLLVLCVLLGTGLWGFGYRWVVHYRFNSKSFTEVRITVTDHGVTEAQAGMTANLSWDHWSSLLHMRDAVMLMTSDRGACTFLLLHRRGARDDAMWADVLARVESHVRPHPHDPGRRTA